MKDKIIVFLFIGYICIFSLLHIILPDKEISTSERRKLSWKSCFELEWRSGPGIYSES